MINIVDEMLAQQFSIALEGRELWIAIKKKYKIDDTDGIVICVTAKKEWLREVEHWILPFAKRKSFKKLLYISSCQLCVEDNNCIQIVLDDKDIYKITKYYRLTNLASKVYVISLDEPFGNENMIGHKGITIADWLKNFG